jgi:hypothetical protein
MDSRVAAEPLLELSAASHMPVGMPEVDAAVAAGRAQQNTGSRSGGVS